MKNILKTIFTLSLIFILAICLKKYAFAEDLDISTDKQFYITGGLDLSDEDEVTFDNTKTITGKANKDDIIQITIYQKLPQKYEPLRKITDYYTIIGTSGYFSQDIELVVGQNLIIVELIQGDTIDFISTSVVCKNDEIKNELEQVIALPRLRK